MKIQTTRLTSRGKKLGENWKIDGEHIIRNGIGGNGELIQQEVWGIGPDFCFIEWERT